MTPSQREQLNLAEEDHREGAERDWWKLSRWVDAKLKEQP